MAEQDFSAIADSTDWLATPLGGLTAVESTLRCQVCRDFYKTPMLTTCLHTFCSLCIRRSLANDGKCPLCRAPDQESKLRWNGAMDDVVDAYVRTRAAVLAFARNTHEGACSPKRKMDTETPEEDDAPAPKRLRSSARLRTSQGPRPPVQIEDSGDEEYRLSDDDGMTPCPICNRRMKEWQVFSHLDKCTGPAPSSPSSSRTLGNLETGRQSNASPRKQQNNTERLPALNYSMIKEQALRKKLAELGISSTGPRALLERRHKEWCTIWNANCDAVKPKPRAQLLRDLETWERTQGGRVPPTFRNTTSIKDKEFDGGAWAAKYDESFKDLIANARRNRPQKQESPKKDGDAADEACSNEVLSL